MHIPACIEEEVSLRAYNIIFGDLEHGIIVKAQLERKFGGVSLILVPTTVVLAGLTPLTHLPVWYCFAYAV